MTRINKKLLIYILAIIYAVFQLVFNKDPLSNSLIINPTNFPTPTSCTGQACLTPTINISDKQTVLVTRVIDGDTIEIEGKIKVRYIGVNTPELHDPKKPIECFGQAASDENKKLVEGKEIYIQKDISETDKFKRLLRYVWVGDIFVNDYLVRQGFAQVSTFPPDVKFQQQFIEAQTEARENKRGLWSQCPIKY